MSRDGGRRGAPWAVLGLGPMRIRYRRRTVILAACLATALLAVAIVDVTAGGTLIPPHALLTGRLSRGQAYVVHDVRLPRLLDALVAGFAFGLGGSLFQNLTRNPLGSPDVLGVTAGGSTGAVVAITAWKASTGVIGLAAVAGAVVVAIPLALLATVGRRGMGAVILIGMGYAFLLNAINSWLLLRASPEVSYQAGRWLTGTLEFASWSQVPRTSGAVLVAATLFLACVRVTPLLGFTDQENAAIGAEPRIVNAALMAFGIAFVSIGVWTTGPMTLLSFFAPQVAQRLSRGPMPPLYLSGLVGSVTLICADLISRLVLDEAEVTVGSIVLVLGGLYLLWTLLRGTSRTPV